jgi:polysaccharide export outer membrane protein
MNLLYPRYQRQRSQNRGVYPARGGPRTFSLFAVCAVLWLGALGYPPAACAQNDAPPTGSVPAAIPGAVGPGKAAAGGPGQSDPKAQNLLKAESTKVDTPKADAPKGVPAGGARTGTSAASKSYIIGPNDVLNIKVWNQAQISGMVDVHLDGMISLPLVGEIRADGLTQVQLKDVITKRLEEVLTAPEVDVNVLKINSKHYSVYGSVMRGGEFVLAERITIMDALSLAVLKDGFAKLNKIELRRGKEKFLFNYKDFIKGKNMDKNINYELQDGDVIIVPE